MGNIISGIIAFILSASMFFGISGDVEKEPEDAASVFLKGITTCDRDVTELYLNNKYVNFLVNAEGDKDTVKDMNTAIFKNVSYEIIDTASKDDVAVAKVKVRTNDFSDVMKKYDDASYDYVVSNLYSDKVTDKDKLSKECFRIYVNQIEKLAKEKPSRENVIYIPMSSDGYGGWNIIANDKLMETLMGNIAIPSLNTK